MVVDWTINPGYLITIVGMASALIYALGQSKHQLEDVAKKLEEGGKEMGVRLASINSTLEKHSERDSEFNASSRVMEQRMATVEMELTRSRDALSALTNSTYMEAMRIVKTQKSRTAKELTTGAP